MKNVIVLFGKPNAGKGTRLEEFLERRKDEYEVLSVGNLLRKARADQTELGKQAAYYMDTGLMVPDDIINAVVIEGIKSCEKTIFTDGFPRTVGQAEAMLNAGVYPTKVIEFFVDDSVILERASHRLVCPKCGAAFTTTGFKPPKVAGICDNCGSTLSKRADDDPSVVQNRLKVYQEETLPVLDVLAKANIEIHTIDNTFPETAKKQFEELLLSI